jgi:integrase
VKGSMTQLGPGTFRLRVYIGRTGKGAVRHRHRTFHGGKRAAEDALRRFVAEIEGERPELPEDCTLTELLERWLKHIEAERTRYTLADYRQKIDKRINPTLGKVRLSRLSPILLDATYRSWTKDGLSPATVRKLHAIVAAACHQACKWGNLVNSPTDRATLPRAEHHERGTVTGDEIAAILSDMEVTDGDVLPTAIVLGALTGARRGELCALRWSDLNVSTRGLRIARSLTVRATDWTEGPTKSRHTRPVQLGDVALYVLECRRQAQEALAVDVGVQLVKDPFVLSRAADGSLPCLPDGLTLGFRRLAMKLGLPWHFHDLRHFAATVAMTSGVNPRAVADRLGHADPALTMRVYTHPREETDRQLARAADASLPFLALPVATMEP